MTSIDARADALQEMAKFSVFENVDLAQLAQGDGKTLRGAPMSNTHFQSVQSCFVLPGAPAQVIAAMKNYDPSRHSELNVLMHVNGSNFSALSKAPNGGPVQALVSSTQSLAEDLQVSKNEAAKLSAGAANTGSMSGPIVAFWTNVLSGRAQAFASGGSASQPAYDHLSTAIRPNEELNGLLNQQPKIRKQFSSFLEGTGIGRSGGGKPDQYWELLNVESKGVLTLGASYSRGTASGGYEAADVLYYASGGYYVALTLSELWPVNVGGRPSTLVWRGDMISSAELADLRGVERLGAETSMIKDISRAVRLFRRDTGGGR